MLIVTDAALYRLSRKLARRASSADVALRFTHKAGAWKLCLGRARPADTAFAHEGRNVLLLDAAAVQGMGDMTLDVKDTAAGPRLTLG